MPPVPYVLRVGCGVVLRHHGSRCARWTPMPLCLELLHSRLRIRLGDGMPPMPHVLRVGCGGVCGCGCGVVDNATRDGCDLLL
mmetsp:Transcript_12369/g.28835  ORF Transcript_12369/g.28835 Transcript_12369/m.28835 type:complete len:83 (-) Transcript_12369:782-1030(-)